MTQSTALVSIEELQEAVRTAESMMSGIYVVQSQLESILSSFSTGLLGIHNEAGAGSRSLAGRDHPRPVVLSVSKVGRSGAIYAYWVYLHWVDKTRARSGAFSRKDRIGPVIQRYRKCSPAPAVQFEHATPEVNAVATSHSQTVQSVVRASEKLTKAHRSLVELKKQLDNAIAAMPK